MCGLEATTEEELELFCSSKTYAHGRLLVCKKCRREKVNNRYHENLLAARAYFNKYQTAKKKERKLHAIEYKGGKCEVCGLVGVESNQVVFDFHHLDPTLKDYTPSNLMDKSLERLHNELDKCILLCSNCHRQVHSGDIKL